MRTDVITGMFFANLVMYFIVPRARGHSTRTEKHIDLRAPGGERCGH
jgi:hypothetical protein